MRSLKSSLLWSSVILFVITASANAYLPVIDLGTLPDKNRSYAQSINNNGQIVGGSWSYGTASRGCLFNSANGGSNINLGNPAGGDSGALSINDKSQIVGYAFSSHIQASILDSTGNGFTPLGFLPNYQFVSKAYSINNNGQIVGYAGKSSDTNFRACLFDSAGHGANINLGTLPGGNYDQTISVAHSINNNGQIVGGSSCPHMDFHACLFDATGNGNNIDLGTFGNDYSIAYSINDLGQIVGTIYTRTGGNNRACIFDISGDPNKIVNLGAGKANSINNYGQVVGYTSGGACLFDTTGQGENILLDSLIDPASGWHLREALSINDNGWIVGRGYYDGLDRAFLLTPEPASVLLFIFGGVTILRNRNHRLQRLH